MELIKPVTQGKELIKEIEESNVESGVALWWLGQSGFVVKSGETILYIDPYLSEHLTKKYAETEKPHIRMTEAPYRGNDVSHADAVLSTHKHSDHMDPVTIPAIMKASPQATYIVPRAHKDHVLSWGLEEECLILADVDQAIHVKEAEIIPQPASHEAFDYIEGIGYPHMSYIIKLGGLTLYHSGDTIPYTGMCERLSAQNVDIAMLPINGRDFQRHKLGTPGNFTIEETFCLGVMAGIKTIIPHHYQMFTFNTVDITDFEAWGREFWPEQHFCVLKCGEKKLFSLDRS